MIKTTALTPRLAEIGKIKTGGKGETRQGKNGPYQLPIRFGHFKVTTTERMPDGNFKPNKEVMDKLDPKPRELSIRLLFDDISMNLQTEFAMYMGKKKLCSGDGETANRLKKKGKALTDEREQIKCSGTECEHFKEVNGKKGTCKVSARLFCAIPTCMQIGGIHVFRTHSINSVMSMMGALNYFKSNTNGILQGLPLKLILVKKQTEEHGEVDFVTIVLDGLEMLEMRKSAVKELEQRKLLGVDVGKYESSVKASGILIDHDDPEEVQSEFYPDKEPKQVQGTTANDTAAKLADKGAKGDDQKQETDQKQTETDTSNSPV